MDSITMIDLLRKKYEKIQAAELMLLEVPEKKYMQANIESLRILANDLGYEGVYITFGQTAADLKKKFAEANIDIEKLYFIDAIAATFGADEEKDADPKIIHASGPINIDEISAKLRDVIPKLSTEKKFVFIDSITSISLYNAIPRTIRFTQFISTMFKESEVTGVIVSIMKGDETNKLIEDLKSAVTDFIRIADDDESPSESEPASE